MKLGINTFGIAKLLHKNFDGTLQSLHDFGYTSIEPCIFFDCGMPALKRTLSHANLRLWKFDGGMWSSSTNAKKRIEQVRAAGFLVFSVQSSGDVCSFLSEGLDDALGLLRNTGIRYLIISPMKKTYEEARKLIPLMKKAAQRLQKEGIALVLHNHEHECVRQADGGTLLDFYINNVPSLALELDVGWVEFAGDNAVRLMQQYRERLVLLHLKDIKKGAPRGRCFTAIGEGDISLADILAQAKLCPNLDEHGILIDQDKSKGDMFADLKRGAKNVYSLSYV